MKKIILYALTIFCIMCVTFVYGVGVQKDLSDNLVRMHIVANSDSENDQKIKLAVRNKILNNIEEKSTISDLQNVADSELLRLGTEYTAKASVERCYVPVKDYKNISLPEGYYNCIRVVLGNGEGKNWWCVAYPPLCFTEEVFGDMSEEGKAELKQKLNSESLDTIIKNGNVNYRFKIVEQVQKIRQML